jgi:hypothetical protein
MPDKAPGQGHNLASDDRKVLYFMHIGLIGRLDDQIAELREKRSSLRKQAKADGFELGVEIDEGLRIRNAEDDSIIADGISKRLWVARMHGLTIVDQLDLFGPASTDSLMRAFDAGLQAGLMANDPKPPMDPGAEFNSWMEGWHAGQAKVREVMQRRMEAANAADAAEIVDEEDVRPRFLQQDGAASDADPFPIN